MANNAYRNPNARREPRPPMNNSPEPSKDSCQALMCAIMEADFFAMDLKLYLDTHPNDKRAIEMFREAVKQYKACKAAFEDSYWPLQAYSAGKDDTWDWLDGRFPPKS